MLSTMAEEGFVERTPDTGQYVIGHGAFQVGSVFISRSDLLSAAMPELRQLSERGVTGFLSILRDDRVIYMAAVQGSGPIAVRTEIGTAAFPHTTALGKVLIADLEEDAIRATLGDTLTSMTDPGTSLEECDHVPSAILACPLALLHRTPRSLRLRPPLASPLFVKEIVLPSYRTSTCPSLHLRRRSLAMTDQHAHPRTCIGHPAPGGHRVGDWLLVFSFLVVPVA